MKAVRIHPLAWLWEPLAADRAFVLRPLFGARAAYLDGRIVLGLAARREPWRGLLIATEREHHASLRAQFSALRPHPVLRKWLYLPESAPGFDPAAVALVALARARDPRVGVLPPAARHRRRRATDHP